MADKEKKESKGETSGAAKPPEMGRRYKKGERVKGSKAPHGGNWIYDPQTDELTLAEEPTEKD